MGVGWGFFFLRMVTRTPCVVFSTVSGKTRSSHFIISSSLWGLCDGPRWLGLAHTPSHSCNQMLVAVAETAGLQSSWLCSAGSLGIFSGFHPWPCQGSLLLWGPQRLTFLIWRLRAPQAGISANKTEAEFLPCLSFGHRITSAMCRNICPSRYKGKGYRLLFLMPGHHYHHKMNMGSEQLFGLVCFLLLNDSRE